MSTLERLAENPPAEPAAPAVGVFAVCDPRIDQASRRRAANIVEMVAKVVASGLSLPGGKPVRVVYSPVLVDGERQADAVARQFRAEGAEVLICAPDTWAFPQLGLISLLSQLPEDTPLNLTCGNSGPKPGVVFTHAAHGAISQYGRLVHINVGTWPDTGERPEMTQPTADALLDWAFAALTHRALKGRRVVIFGHDSMGMETALAHIIPTRRAFGLEITRLDMKLLADMLQKEAYEKKELRALRQWLTDHLGDRIELRSEDDGARLDTSLAMYLIVRDIMRDLNAVGGGFMSQLEWGSDLRGIPLPVADVMESLFNSTFDHEGPKAPVPYATEADVQGLLTMLFFTYLTAGNPPLFMDFRKVWEPWEIARLAESLGMGSIEPEALWRTRGFVDGDNSGSASLDWAGAPGTSVEEIMAGVTLPIADPGYFPGGGNSVTFVSPGGIEGIAARLAYSADTNLFSLVWDEAQTVALPDKLAQAVCNTSTPTWPHTFVVPKHATMGEYKQYAPANHFHMTWGLKPARLQYWMDLANVLSVTPWQERPAYREGIDRPRPLLHLLDGGELSTKLLRAKRSGRAGGSASVGSAGQRLFTLHRRIRRCTACRLHAGRRHAVPGEGPAAAPVMFIGEAPGAAEDEQGRPFVGPAGRFLDTLFREVGLDRTEVYITSSVKCRPPKNRTPRADELRTCKERWLNAQIETISPRAIVLLGQVAIRQVLRETGPLGVLHGRVRFEHGRGYAITYHPAAAMRFPEIAAQMREDFARFRELIT